MSQVFTTVEMVSDGEAATAVFRASSWATVAKLLGTTPQTIRKCRLALGREDEEINSELVSEIRLMVLFCDRRNRGGGVDCTRRGYMRLKRSGQLEARLSALGIS